MDKGELHCTGLAKKFVRGFRHILWQAPNEFFGHPIVWSSERPWGQGREEVGPRRGPGKGIPAKAVPSGYAAPQMPPPITTMQACPDRLTPVVPDSS